MTTPSLGAPPLLNQEGSYPATFFVGEERPRTTEVLRCAQDDSDGTLLGAGTSTETGLMESGLICDALRQVPLNSICPALKNAKTKQKGGRSLPFVRTGAELTFLASGRFGVSDLRTPARIELCGYFTLAKIMAKVNRASVSMNTNPRIMNRNRPGRAPGLRAMPSQADAATRDCP